MMSPIAPRKSSWLPDWPWLSNPWITVIGTVTGIVGLGSLLYSWIITPVSRYVIITSDPPVTIVRGGQASSVDVLYRGNKVTTDVFARQVNVWNAGSDSIRRENILEPIGIVIPRAMILETRIKKVSRLITNISAKIDGDKVMLSWNILEHNDGAAIDIIYAAPDAGKLEAVGIVEHQPQVRVHQYETTRDVALGGWQRTVILWVFGVMAVFAVVGGVRLVKEVVAPKQKLPVGAIVFMCLLAVVALFAGSCCFWVVFTATQAPTIPPVF